MSSCSDFYETELKFARLDSGKEQFVGSQMYSYRDMIKGLNVLLHQAYNDNTWFSTLVALYLGNYTSEPLQTFFSESLKQDEQFEPCFMKIGAT